MREKIVDYLFVIFNILMIVVFLPILFCVIVIGDNMDYNEAMKLSVNLPNYLLFFISLFGIGTVCALLIWERKKFPKKLTNKANVCMDIILSLLFIVLFFLNEWIAREIVFHLPWDIMVVRNGAYQVALEQAMGYQYYFSMNPNNIPIIYILGRIYRAVEQIPRYPYISDFAWVQLNCILISITGYFSCLMVKKLTRRMMPTLLMFLLYVILIGISPWKIAPYTDVLGLLFPVLCIYFYICYRQARGLFGKYIWMILSVLVGVTGGFIKPNLYIIVIALLGREIILLIKNIRGYWHFVLVQIVLTLGLMYVFSCYKEHIIEEIGLEYNENIEASWHHYFLMGLNEETTGGYSAGDKAIFGEFQDEERSVRNQAEIERAFERIRERGFWGSIYFYLRKLVMTFNDGCFGWRTEVWVHQEYPLSIKSNSIWAQRVRAVFLEEDGYGTWGYNTPCQLVWIFSMLAIPGICLCKGKKREKYSILVISFLGIFMYQMLFEARARYLFAFLPVILVVAVCGIQQYAICLMYFWKRIRKEGVRE